MNKRKRLSPEVLKELESNYGADYVNRCNDRMLRYDMEECGAESGESDNSQPKI